MKQKKRVKKRTMEDQLAFWNFWKVAVPVIGTILTGIASVFVYIKATSVEKQMKISEAKKIAMSGIIHPKQKGKNNKPKGEVTIWCGSNRIGVSKNQLSEGYTFAPLLAVGIDYPLTCRLTDDNKFLVNFLFRDLSGRLTARMYENEWQVNPDNFFERNYDDTGFEVIDKAGITNFQINFIDSTNIKIGGVIVGSDRVYVITDLSIINFKKTQTKTLSNLTSQIPHLFKYPSRLT